MHTAVKIAPQYNNGVVHVLDASRSVTVAGSLLSKDQRQNFLNGVAGEYIKLKEQFDNKKTAKQYISYADAAANALNIEWQNSNTLAPTFTETKF